MRHFEFTDSFNIIVIISLISVSHERPKPALLPYESLIHDEYRWSFMTIIDSNPRSLVLFIFFSLS